MLPRCGSDHEILKYALEADIDRREWFIEEDHIGIDRQRPRDGGALAHAAG